MLIARNIASITLKPINQRLCYLTSICQISKRMYSISGNNGTTDSFIDVKPCTMLANTTHPEYVKSAHSNLHNLIWTSPLQNIYVVKKPWNHDVRNATLQFLSHIHENYPAVNVIVNESVAEELIHEVTENSGTILQEFKEFSRKPVIFTGKEEDIINKTDLIVTLGGDGTILRAVSVFLNEKVPPVLSFALGTLGFLLPFDFRKLADTFKMVYESRAKALHRNRLECYVVRRGEKIVPEVEQIGDIQSTNPGSIESSSMIHAMNDIVLHRGSQPNLTSLDIFIDGEFLTTTTADGIVLSTPTGSTAYSLSSGGSISHPLVPCILLTPICPRSLSFRPLILPSSSHIMLKLSDNNRNHFIRLSIDGISQQDLKPGDQIHVVNENNSAPSFGPVANEDDLLASVDSDCSDLETSSNNPNGIWCIARSENDWTKDINELLGFNSSFRGQKKH